MDQMLQFLREHWNEIGYAVVLYGVARLYLNAKEGEVLTKVKNFCRGHGFKLVDFDGSAFTIYKDDCDDCD